MDLAIERFVESVDRRKAGDSETDRLAKEIKQIDDTVTALTMQIDPANLVLLNDRLTQLRLRKECLENELRVARQSNGNRDPGTMRSWARAQLTGLQAAIDGTRNDVTRNVLGTYVDRITVWPSKKRGEMRLNPAAHALWKSNWEERRRRDQRSAAKSPRNQNNRPKDGRG